MAQMLKLTSQWHEYASMTIESFTTDIRIMKLVNKRRNKPLECAIFRPYSMEGQVQFTPPSRLPTPHNCQDPQTFDVTQSPSPLTLLGHSLTQEEEDGEHVQAVDGAHT